MDFINDLENGETLISSKWSMTVLQGADPSPNVHLEGPSIVVVPADGDARTATIQRIGGVFPDVTYIVEAVVITSLGNTRSLWSHIRGVNGD
jgi:hypothetical protein